MDRIEQIKRDEMRHKTHHIVVRTHSNRKLQKKAKKYRLKVIHADAVDLQRLKKIALN